MKIGDLVEPKHKDLLPGGEKSCGIVISVSHQFDGQPYANVSWIMRERDTTMQFDNLPINVLAIISEA